jgi:ribosomal protein S5
MSQTPARRRFRFPLYCSRTNTDKNETERVAVVNKVCKFLKYGRDQRSIAVVIAGGS